MSALSVAEVANLQPSCPIRSVAGRIDKLFPIERPRGWNYQNGFLKDQTTKAEIRFQFKNWDREVPVDDFQGGFIELVANDDESLVWKKQAQRKPGDAPLVKLEILHTATVVRLLKGSEYRASPPVAHRPAHPAPAGGRLAVPDIPTPFPPQSGAGRLRADAMANNLGVKQEIHQLGVLYVLCSDEAAVLVKGDIASADVTEAAAKLFAQAARQGVHQKIDAASFWKARDPEVAAKLGLATAPPQLPPHVAQMAELIGEDQDRERKANKMLRELLHIAGDQTWRDLSDDKAAEILRAGFFQVALAA